MSDIKIQIQLQSTAEDEVKSINSKSEVYNASIQKTETGDFVSVSTKNNGVNMKSWATGELSLDDGYVGGANTQLIEQYGYNGYVFGAVPKSRQLEVEIEIVGSNIDSIVVYGDKTANQFPTKAYIDGDISNIIYSDDAEWTIKFNNASSLHTITFLEWNRVDYNACITYIGEMKNELVLDKKWINSISSLSQSTGQPKDIYYGVIANTGNSDINDIGGEIKDLLEDGILSASNLPISVFANEKQVQSHTIIDSDYSFSGNSKHFNIEMGNILSLWNSVEFNGYDNRVEQTTAYDLFVLLLKSYPVTSDALENMFNEKIEMYDSGEIVDMKQYMQSIIIPNPYLEKSKFLDAVNKICQICQLWIYEDDGGNIKIESARPKMFGKKDVIYIPKSKTYSVNSDVIVKNKYDGTKIFKNEFVRNKDKDTLFTLSGFYAYDKNHASIVNKSDKVYLDGGYSLYTANNNNRMVKLDNYVIEDIKFPNFANEISDLEFEVTKTFVDGSSYSYYLPRFRIDTDYFSDFSDVIETKFENNKLVISFRVTAYDPSESNLIVNTQYMYSFTLRIVGYSKQNNYVEYNFGNNKFELPQNEILQTDSLVNSINNNIVADYSNGIRTARVTVSCLDFYNTHNKIAKVWANGEIISVGDFVQLETLTDKNGHMITWKVVGREFVYNGVPMVNLELMEVKETRVIS